MEKKIFAIIGMKGSGKTEIIKYLQEKHNWPKIYLPQSLFDEIEKRGMPLNWESEKFMRAHLREQHGIGVFGMLALPKIEELLEKNDVVLLESLYSWDEYKIIKKKYQHRLRTIFAYASPDVRLARLQKREHRPVSTMQELQEIEWHEIEATDKGGPIAIADHTIINHGTLEEFHRNIDDVMGKEGIN